MTRLTKLSAALVGSIIVAGNSLAQEEKLLQPAINKATEINQSAVTSQQKINKITDQN